MKLRVNESITYNISILRRIILRLFATKKFKIYPLNPSHGGPMGRISRTLVALLPPLWKDCTMKYSNSSVSRTFDTGCFVTNSPKSLRFCSLDRYFLYYQINWHTSFLFRFVSRDTFYKNDIILLKKLDRLTIDVLYYLLASRENNWDMYNMIAFEMFSQPVT